MTAEIAILNRTGIALAADSAVTIQSESSNEKKIYNSSNKLFSLSKFHPVGVMVFGNATLLGLPWEVIIKRYRSQLWNTELNTLPEYADDLKKHLEHVLPPEVQQKYFENNTSSYINLIRQDIVDQVKKATQNETKISLINIKRVISITLKQHLDRMKKYKNLPEIPIDFEKQVINDREKVVNEIIEKVFEKLPITKGNRKTLLEIISLLFIKDIFSENYSGVVVAGFGKNDNFPSLVELQVDGVIDNVIKYKVKRKIEIGYNFNAVIVPFAQDEMVCTFMEGVNPKYQDTINGIISELLDKYPKELINNITQIPAQEKNNLLVTLMRIGEEIKRNIEETLRNYRKIEFIDPVLSAVEVLPKDELAIMAETLVNLTSFKRKMSLDAETVGGPIDVAVISKGDGFVWIKRKHYFPPELNHQYFNNYFIRDKEQEKT